MSDDLVSVRGLVDSDFDMPVKEFDGVFAGYETAPASGYDGTRVNLNYKDIDNVVAVSPYNLPTVVLNMGLSNKKKSRFGYYGSSLADLIPADMDIKDCAGQAHHVVFADGEDGRPEPKPIWNKTAGDNWKLAIALTQKMNAVEDSQQQSNLQDELNGLGELHKDGMVPTPVWLVTSVDGVGTAGGSGNSGQSATEWAEENLVGKTRADFNKWAFTDPRVRKDIQLTRSITDKSFVNGLVQIRRVEEDENGVFQVSVAAA